MLHFYTGGRLVEGASGAGSCTSYFPDISAGQSESWSHTWLTWLEIVHFTDVISSTALCTLTFSTHSLTHSHTYKPSLLYTLIPSHLHNSHYISHNYISILSHPHTLKPSLFYTHLSSPSLLLLSQVGTLLCDWRRVNVALTRARHKLILIGSSSTLCHAPLLQCLLDSALQEGWIVAALTAALHHNHQPVH